MSGITIVIDFVAALVFMVGLFMTFRHATVRAWWHRLMRSNGATTVATDPGQDPVLYALRIAGVMLMAFSCAIALLFTLFGQAGGSSS